jgi:hypothetical protein
MDCQIERAEGAGRAPAAPAAPGGAPARRTRALIRRGVRERRPVGARYGGHAVVLWPYALGWYRQKLYLRAFIAGGGFRDEHWLPLDQLQTVRLAAAGTDWIPPLGQPAVALAFFDRVDCACEDYAAGEPRPAS